MDKNCFIDNRKWGFGEFIPGTHDKISRNCIIRSEECYKINDQYYFDYNVIITIAGIFVLN